MTSFLIFYLSISAILFGFTYSGYGRDLTSDPVISNATAIQKDLVGKIFVRIVVTMRKISIY